MNQSSGPVALTDSGARRGGYKTKEAALEAIKAYFKGHFPDFPAEVARVFRKASCNDCYGRGLQTRVKAGSTERDPAELGYCGCVRNALNRKAESLVASRQLYTGGR